MMKPEFLSTFEHRSELHCSRVGNLTAFSGKKVDSNVVLPTEAGTTLPNRSGCVEIPEGLFSNCF